MTDERFVAPCRSVPACTMRFVDGSLRQRVTPEPRRSPANALAARRHQNLRGGLTDNDPTDDGEVAKVE